MDSLGQEVFAGLTVLHLAIAASALIVLIAIVKWLASGSKESGSYMVVATCPKCGWSGEVSKYNRICKRCSGEI